MLIEIKDVSKFFKTKSGDVQAVDDVSIQIDQGEIFGVIGYSGAGKSTLIRLLNGLETVSSGDIRIGDDYINALSGKSLRQKRQKVSMIFQHFNLLWSRTVEQNISFPLEIAGVNRRERKKRVKELIDLVGLTGREKAYPSQLSGGQKQRVGIARALSNEPEVLLCDEATSALDPETTDEVLDLLLDIREKLGLTIVLITHEMHVIRKICDRAAVMENGRVVEIGEIKQLFRNPQSNVTKRFVKDDIDDEETNVSFDAVREQFPNAELVKLSFVGSKSKTPIVSKIIKKYDVDMNIIAGSIKHTNKESFGHLHVTIDTSPSILEAITKDLEAENVKLEVETHG